MAILSDDVSKMFSRMQFMAILPTLTQVIMRLSAIIRNGLEKNLFDFSSP